jgi:phosphinothricin acetyltransferase
MRQRGVGRALYEALEKELIDIGILNMNACIAYISAPDRYLNNDSMYFHREMGFELVGTFHKCGYKFGKWYDMIWMEKLIGEHVDKNCLGKS